MSEASDRGHECNDCARLHGVDNELVRVILQANHDELAMALHVRDHEGQRRFEEFHELMGLLTDFAMTRNGYTLPDLLAFLEDRRKEGVPCGLCESIFPKPGVCQHCEGPLRPEEVMCRRCLEESVEQSMGFGKTSSQALYREIHRDQHNLGRDAFQQRHPLTCGNDSRHAVLEPFPMGGGVGLYCPECDYVQPFPPHLAGYIGTGRES
jgi:hypothetical protein